MDTDIKLLKAFTQMCVDAHRAMVEQGKDRDLFDLALLDTTWQLGSLAIQLGLNTDS